MNVTFTTFLSGYPLVQLGCIFFEVRGIKCNILLEIKVKHLNHMLTVETK